MYKKILVPVDGSPTSLCGLREAIRLAKDQGASLRLLHVVHELLLDASYMAFEHATFLKVVRDAGKQILENMQAETRAQGLTAESELLETLDGRAADMIVAAATRWGADLIVMGTHGRRGVQRLLMGSDAGLVVSSSTVPVLMVRDTQESNK